MYPLKLADIGIAVTITRMTFISVASHAFTPFVKGREGPLDSRPLVLPRRRLAPGRAVGEFQAIGQRDEQALRQAHGAAEGAEAERRTIPDDQGDVGFARQGTHAAVGDG